MKTYPNIKQALGIVALFFLFSVLFSPILFVSQKIVSSFEMALMIYYLMVAGGTFLIILYIRKKITRSLKINSSIGKTGPYAFMALAAIALLSLSSVVAGLIPDSYILKSSLAKIAGQTGIYTFIYFVVFAPIFEELIFRGVMLDGLLKKYSPLKSIIVSSLLFGIAHLNPWQFVSAFFLGNFSGWVYFRTRSVVPSILIHAVTNGYGFISRYFFHSIYDKEPSSKPFNDIMFWVYLMLALTILLISIYLLDSLLPGRKNINLKIEPHIDEKY